MRLRDRFKNELAFSRYLQGSSTFRTVVERELGLKIRKTNAVVTKKEVQLFKRPHRLDFPDHDRLWRPSDHAIVEAANKEFGELRIDLILCSDDDQQILVENQFGLSDLNHRKRLMESYNSTQWPGSPERDDWSWVFWIAEDFRDQDIEWVREHGHPVAMFKAWPKGNSVRFEFVYTPIGIDHEPGASSQVIKKRPEDEW